MQNSLSLFVWCKVFAVIALLFLPVLAWGQSNAGVGISPAVIEGPADPGETQTHTIEIRNLSGADQIFYLFVRDIRGVTGAGAPIFAKDGDEKTGYELSEWVSLSTTEIDLAVDERTTIEIEIAVPENATPGSHFGGVFVSMNPPRLRQTGASVGYDVANIISLRVAGDAVEKASIRQLSTGNYIYGQSVVDFQARIENEGSVLVRPYGPLEVFNMFGKRVAMLTFNDNQAGVFPGVTRDFDIVWEDEGPGFGRYEGILSLVYGESGGQKTISSTVSFWILPMNIIMPAVGVLATLLLMTYIAVRLYVRSKLRMSHATGRRLVRQRPQSKAPLGLLLLTSMFMVTAVFVIILLLLFA